MIIIRKHLYLVLFQIFSLFLFSQEVITLSCGDTPVSDITIIVLTEAYKKMGIDDKIKNLPAERSLFESNKQFDG